MSTWRITHVDRDGTVTVSCDSNTYDPPCRFARKKDAEVYIKARRSWVGHNTAIQAVILEQVSRKREKTKAKAQDKLKSSPAMLYESTPPAGYTNH